ncbi:MAG: LD-carboxypeptidase [Bacteroidota bacterium]
MKTIPPFLQPGDVIGICAPARKVSPEEMKDGIAWLSEKGFRVKESSNLYKQQNQFSGTDAERASDLQLLINDPEVKAILFARGGYGCVRIIDQVDFTPLEKHPKWLIGFSDMTVIHSHVNRHKLLCTLHAPMMINLMDDKRNEEAANKIIDVLTGKSIRYTSSSQELNRLGTCEGELVGGNLSLLYALAGTPSDINTDGKILFIEDLDEYLYHIDRMMMQLKRSGKLKKLKGLIVGGMSDMRDNAIPFGKSAEEIISEAVSEYSYPVCFNFPSGHIDRNLPLIFGAEVKLEVGMNVDLTFLYESAS